MTKVCTHCFMAKPLEEFHRSKYAGDGRYPSCATCKRAEQRAWRASHPEEVAANNARRREGSRLRARAWRAANPGATHTAYLKYAGTLRGHLAALSCQIRRRSDGDSRLTTEFLADLWTSQLGKCAISGRSMTHTKGAGIVDTNASVDRIDPGGRYRPGNVRLVCYRVNVMKHAGTDKELLEWCKTIVRAETKGREK